MPDEPSLPPPGNPASAARLWKRYRKARGARLGLFLVLAFSFIAFLAPFIAHRLPLFWYDSESGVTMPLIREFFAPADTTEPMLERGINFLMLLIPASLLAWRLLNKYLPSLKTMESRFISLLFGALFSATLWLAIGGMVVDAGGNDWLYYENPPVPDIDDMDNIAVFLGDENGAATPDRGSLRELLRQHGVLPPETQETGIDLVDDIHRRRLITPVQEAIEGSAIAPVAETAARYGIDPLDITDANLAIGINTSRWNRLLIEAAYPGFLVPMRQFRDTFIGMAALSLLVLIGLSYIFLAGAGQFTLSPRWLVLLALAAVLVLPFRLSPRHNHTPYRQLAAEGKGWGVFPLIPYGPNENVFGPRLPPTWYVESPFLNAASVRSWQQLATVLGSNATDQSAALSRLIDSKLPDWQALQSSVSGQDSILAALNSLIADGTRLQSELITPTLRSDQNLGPFLSAVRSGQALTAVQNERLNRLLLEKALPGVFFPATANHWKKPRDVAGYHLLGTDESGRDVLVRIIHGARVSLSVGFVSVFLATVIGLVMGSLAGYYGGRIDIAISRFLEIMMCFPSFFLILAVIAVLDRRSIINIMLVIGLTSWTGVARLIRGEMLRHRKMDYVSASIALGASDTRTIFRHILPNAMAPVLVSISFGITGAILTEASLSFIGFGVTPPTPTWGQLLSETRDSPLANWWLAVFPGIVLFASVIAYNMVGESLRDALDPRTTL